MNEVLTKFEVKNFKKFDHLVIENLGMVNLITGDNNVGKTCLLEALLLEPSIKTNICYLWHAFISRNFLFDYRVELNPNDVEGNQVNNIVGHFQKNINNPISIKHYLSNNTESEFQIHNRIMDVIRTDDIEIRKFADGLKVYSSIDLYHKNWLLFYLNGELDFMIDVYSKYYQQFFTTEEYDTFISLRDFYAIDLIEYYEEVTKDSISKKYFTEVVNSIFPQLKVIEFEKREFQGLDQLMITTRYNTIFHSVTQYGDGFVRVLRIFLEILLNKGKRILIDEIDVGIHYLRIAKFWEALFEVAEKTNTQIFATSHSLDCVKAYVQAANANQKIQNNIRLIELEEFTSKGNENKQIANTYDFETMKFKLETGTNIRGGDVWQ